MSKNNKHNDELERKQVEMPTIGDNLENVDVGDLQRAEISDEDRKKYEQIFKKSKWQKIKNTFKETWNGNNKVGRYLGLGLSVGESFLPKWVSRIRYIIQSKTKKRGSNMKWLKNRLKERTTWQGIVSVLTALGVGLSPDQKEAIITAGAAIVTAIWVFVKEPQSEDT